MVSPPLVHPHYHQPAKVFEKLTAASAEQGLTVHQKLPKFKA
ncbi:unnamed protein product, partial [Staurois parvus]